MGQADSIKVKFGDVLAILRNDSKATDKVDVPNQPVEGNLNGNEVVFPEWDLDDSQVIERFEALELSLIDFHSCDHLTIVEPQGVNLGIDLIKLLTNQCEAHLTEGDRAIGFALDFEGLTFGEGEVVSLD